jgi:hypothetical protein
MDINITTEKSFRFLHQRLNSNFFQKSIAGIEISSNFAAPYTETFFKKVGITQVKAHKLSGCFSLDD